MSKEGGGGREGRQGEEKTRRRVNSGGGLKE